MRKILLAVIMAASVVSTAQAGDGASDCITVENGEMTNNCNQAISVMYCHGPSSKRNTKDTECGYNGTYYHQTRTLGAGQSHSNSMTIPDDATMNWAACYGNVNIRQNSNGSFSCPN